jgi:hypothetical protein
MAPPPTSDFREQPCSAACSGWVFPVNRPNGGPENSIEESSRPGNLLARLQQTMPRPGKRWKPWQDRLSASRVYGRHPIFGAPLTGEIAVNWNGAKE